MAVDPKLKEAVKEVLKEIEHDKFHAEVHRNIYADLHKKGGPGMWVGARCGVCNDILEYMPPRVDLYDDKVS